MADRARGGTLAKGLSATVGALATWSQAFLGDALGLSAFSVAEQLVILDVQYQGPRHLRATEHDRYVRRCRWVPVLRGGGISSVRFGQSESSAVTDLVGLLGKSEQRFARQHVRSMQR